MYPSERSTPETTPGQREDGAGEAQAYEPQEPAAVQTGPGTVGSALSEILQTLLLALVLFLVIRNFVQNYRVENISMQPNFYEGQFLIINRFAYCPGFHLDLPVANVHWEKTWCVSKPSRGDVVVFHYPPDPTKDYIKRVIGLPGETVEIRAGNVYINGRLMSQPFGPNPGTYSAPPVTLGPDQVYVLGDNRNSSSDSHIWGPVPMQDLVGRSIVRYWPPSKWSTIPKWNFPELTGATAGG